jgi:hypothetical protein
MFTFAAVLISLHVVKTLRNIFLYLLVLMFLVPATGFYYTRHSCLKSGEVQLVLNVDHSCYAETARITDDPVNQECSLEKSSLGCCINEGNYLKSEDEYTFPGRVEMPHITIIITTALNSTDLFQYVQESIEENAHSPPFTLSSVDILHKYSILII